MRHSSSAIYSIAFQLRHLMKFGTLLHNSYSASVPLCILIQDGDGDATNDPNVDVVRPLGLKSPFSGQTISGVLIDDPSPLRVSSLVGIGTIIGDWDQAGEPLLTAHHALAFIMKTTSQAIQGAHTFTQSPCFLEARTCDAICNGTISQLHCIEIVPRAQRGGNIAIVTVVM